MLWTSSWCSPEFIVEAIHPAHSAHLGGFVVEDRWITEFWLNLAKERLGVRVQVHTHPRAAFHSPTDDDHPIVHTPGFLSLVIPNFALGAIGFKGAYLTKIGNDGFWRQVDVSSHFRIA